MLDIDSVMDIVETGNPQSGVKATLTSYGSRGAIASQ